MRATGASSYSHAYPYDGGVLRCCGASATDGTRDRHGNDQRTEVDDTAHGRAVSRARGRRRRLPAQSLPDARRIVPRRASRRKDLNGSSGRGDGQPGHSGVQVVLHDSTVTAPVALMPRSAPIAATIHPSRVAPDKPLGIHVRHRDIGAVSRVGVAVSSLAEGARRSNQRTAMQRPRAAIRTRTPRAFGYVK